MGENKKVVSAREIEDLRREFAVSDVIFDGVKAANKWKSGKRVSEDDFKKACESFLNAPVDGRVVKKGAKR